MSSTRISLSAAVLAAVALAVSLPTGGAAPSVTKNLTITATGILGGASAGSGTFELQGANGAETDLGKHAFTEPAIPPLAQKTPEGLTYVPLRFPVTLTGKHGTLVIRISARQFDVVKGDDSIATGNWSVVKGTGRYAGLKGGGALVGMQSTAGRGSISDYAYQFRFQGRVSKG
jgi:hypothetical protein